MHHWYIALTGMKGLNSEKLTMHDVCVMLSSLLIQMA
jgi:hypothetical protein